MINYVFFAKSQVLLWKYQHPTLRTIYANMHKLGILFCIIIPDTFREMFSQTNVILQYKLLAAI